MKKVMKLCFGIVVACILIFSTTLHAQVDNTNFSIERSIALNDANDVKTITFDVAEDITFLQMGIMSVIEYGTLTLEIYDPNQLKQGQFSVEGQLKTNKPKSVEELVSGNISKNLENPTQGTWTIKLIPKNVTGTIKIEYNRLK